MPTKTSLIILCTGALTLGGLAAFADAQPKPAPAAAPSPPADCKQPDCKNEAHGMHGHGMSDDMMKHHGGMGAEQCPMHAAASIADLKVENTKQGATIQLVAKTPADVTKVQELAREIAQHLTMHEAHADHAHAAMPGH